MSCYSKNSNNCKSNGYKTYEDISTDFDKKNFGQQLINEIFGLESYHLKNIQNKICGLIPDRMINDERLNEIVEEIERNILKLNIHLLDVKIDKSFLKKYLVEYLIKNNLYESTDETRVVKEVENDESKDESDMSEDDDYSESEDDDYSESDYDDYSESEEDDYSESEEEEVELSVNVIEKTNPCIEGVYDTNRVEYRYIYEQEALMTVRKGICFKCSAYRPILYTNITSNFNCSQICQKCVVEMFNDAQN